MNILSGNNDFFGLDLGSEGIRLVQLAGNGAKKSLVKYSFVEVNPKISQSDAKADQQKLAQILSELISKSQISTKNVAVSLPSNRVFTTVTDLEKLSHEELTKSINYQVDSLIPTPIEDSKIDWALIGDSPKDSTKVEILLSSITNSYVEKTLDLLEGIGLNVIAFEPSTLALSRSLITLDSKSVDLIVYIDSMGTDIAIVMDSFPRVLRTVAIGNQSIIRSSAQNLNVDDKQAEQLVYKFGISKDKLEGQVYNALIGSLDSLSSEIEKSIRFFANRYGERGIDNIIVSGGASTIPEFPLYLANKFNINVEIGNPWINVAYDISRQNELLNIANHFSVAVGLAERNNGRI